MVAVVDARRRTRRVYRAVKSGSRVARRKSGRFDIALRDLVQPDKWVGSRSLLKRSDLRRSVSLICATGALGSVIIAASSWWVAALPSTLRHNPPTVLSVFPFGGAVPRVCYYVGLALVVVTWLAFGRWLLVHGRPLPARDLLRYVLSVAAPLLVAAPVASRDLWAYAAQGNMMVRGVNPYVFGPFTVPGDRPAHWVRVHTAGSNPRRDAAPPRANGTEQVAYRVSVDAGAKVLGALWAVRHGATRASRPGETRVLAAAADQIGRVGR